MKFDLAILDLDSVLHIVAYKQYAAGNRDNVSATKNAVHSFVEQIRKSSNAKDSIGFYQKPGHKNFRNEILPEYKGHREPTEWIKLWKPIIIEAFQEANLFGLSYVESDDAAMYLADYLKFDNVVVVSGDKDIKQIPVPVYNPFKAGMKPEDRWSYFTLEEANELFWAQVMAGDPTDMPGSHCGIQGVGMATAFKKFRDSQNDYIKIVQQAYTEKYGESIGFQRCNLTYKMVRLLRYSSPNQYINKDASSELNSILASYKDYLIQPNNDISTLFDNTPRSASDLFN